MKQTNKQLSLKDKYGPLDEVLNEEDLKIKNHFEFKWIIFLSLLSFFFDHISCDPT
jgi:hypothetical protein